MPPFVDDALRGQYGGVDEPVLRWGRSVGIRSNAPPEFRPGDAVGVLSSIEPTRRCGAPLVIEYLVGGDRGEVFVEQIGSEAERRPKRPLP
jgi:hypothetical protein